MSIKGSPYAWFRRSIEAGRALDAWAAAHELESLALADALALCLVLLDEDPGRYERAAVRWVARLAMEDARPGLDGLLLVLAALSALRADERAAASAALSALLERNGQHACVEVLERWRRSSSA